MRRALLITLSLATITVGSLIQACKRAAATDQTNNYVPQMATKADSIKRGEYLVTSMGCNDCHSAKKMTPRGPIIDSATVLGGYPAARGIPKPEKTNGSWLLFAPDLTAFVGPWGMSFSANISSDRTGIGAWTEEQFMKAMKEGKYKGLTESRDLLPPMPWENFSHVKDGDLKAIFIYLKSTKPVNNVVPDAIPPNKL